MVILPGLDELWQQTLGDPDICIAILDGPADLAHPSLREANLRQLEIVVRGDVDLGPACRHGTHVASVIFGQHGGPVRGIAPGCQGIIVPIFESADGASLRVCSQLDLARALGLAVQHGARVINVSGGEFSPSGTAHPILANAVAECARLGVLIVAATGNDGCACLQVPAALDSVLAVGGMTAAGEPLAFSNWGEVYREQGILAPAAEVLGAVPGDGTLKLTGTSSAAAIVSGVAALLLSLQRRRGRRPDARLVREALLRSALGCEAQRIADCRRLLAGRLNVKGALSIISNEGFHTMSEVAQTSPSSPVRTHNVVELSVSSTAAEPPRPEPERAVSPSTVQPSSCACQGASAAPQLVYAIGQPGYDLVSEARLDSLVQKMAGVAGTPVDRGAAFQHEKLLAYLESHPWDAAAVEWTLSLDSTPIYVIRPQGPFAAVAYEELRRFLREQREEGVERISVPGVITGKARLLMGQVVPVIAPELRGMYSWTTKALVEAAAGPAPPEEAPPETKESYHQKLTGLRSFLDRVYHAMRNLGVMPADRALNFAATNAYSIEKVIEAALKEKERMELESVSVVRSPICRPGSDCWDVEIYFFFPDRQVQTVRKVYRFTVDVSDVVPVTIGSARSWYTR